MALITCPECATSISDKAAACPHCGYPIRPPRTVEKTPKGLWWGLGCLLGIPALLIVIAVIGMLAAIAIPSFVRARSASQEHACINNLRIIDAAKEQWALADAAEPGQPVDIEGVNQYIKGATTPPCPAGGSYTYHVIDIPPECSLHGPLP